MGLFVAAVPSTGCRKDPAASTTAGAPVSEDSASHETCPSGMALIPGRPWNPDDPDPEPVLDPWCMAILETTVADFRRCVEAGACSEPPVPSKGVDTYRTPGRENNPVIIGNEVEAAKAYCTFVGARLPTAEEWEWAFFSADPPRCPWGAAEASVSTVCLPYPAADAERWPCPVGSHATDRTTQGLLDMGGNAVELSDIDGADDRAVGFVFWVHIPIYEIRGDEPVGEPLIPDTLLSWPHGGKAKVDGPHGFRCAADARGIPPLPRPPPVTPEPAKLHDACPPGSVEIPAREEQPSIARFCLGETEVTVGQYRRCVDAGVCTPPDDDEGRNSTWRSGDDDLPLNYADFEPALTYCRFLDGRLPTAEEWTWAYGSARGWPLPWGEELPVGEHVCDRDIDAPGQPPPRCPAGSHPMDRTAQGAYDMAGSLGELVAPEGNLDAGNVVWVLPPSRIPKEILTPEDLRRKYRPRTDLVQWAGGSTDGFRCVFSLRRQATTAQ